MKDQYVGDINDFAKYQLLRLCAPLFAEVVIAWMLTPRDGRTDGGRIQYLQRPGWRAEDPELFDTLAELVAAGNRSIAAVEASRALPRCTFESRPIGSDPAGRNRYFEAVAGLAGPDSLVFFDPDNGIEVASVARHRRGAERYLFWEELGLIRDTGASVLVYQHFPRVDRARYLDSLLARFGREMGGGYAVFAAHTSQVAFLFGIRHGHAPRLLERVRSRCEASALLALVTAPLATAGRRRP